MKEYYKNVIKSQRLEKLDKNHPSLMIGFKMRRSDETQSFFVKGCNYELPVYLTTEPFKFYNLNIGFIGKTVFVSYGRRLSSDIFSYRAESFEAAIIGANRYIKEYYLPFIN